MRELQASVIASVLIQDFASFNSCFDEFAEVNAASLTMERRVTAKLYQIYYFHEKLILFILYRDSFCQLTTRLSGLRSLHMQCHYSIIEHVATLRNLTCLECLVDASSSDRPLQLAKLTNLRSLEFNAESFNEEVFQLTRLEKLKLFTVQFGEIGQLSALKNLTQLELGASSENPSIKLNCRLTQVKNLSLRYLANTSETFLLNFPNLTTFKIRGTFLLPLYAEQLTKLSIGSITFIKDEILTLSRLTNLESLALAGSHFPYFFIDEDCNLPTTLRKLSLEEWDVANVNILPCLTKLGNLETLEMDDTIVAPLLGRGVHEEKIQDFVKAMPQLKRVCFKGSGSDEITFHHSKSWFDFARRNKIYVDFVFT